FCVAFPAGCREVQPRQRDGLAPPRGRGRCCPRGWANQGHIPAGRAVNGGRDRASRDSGRSVGRSWRMPTPWGTCHQEAIIMNGFSIRADGGAESLSISDPASPPAESIRSLSVLVLAITGFIFVAVEGILIYSIVRFRRRAAAGTSLPPERAGESGKHEIE